MWLTPNDRVCLSFNSTPSLPSTIDGSVAASAFKKQRECLLNLIRHCLPSLANSLVSDGIISQDVCERACSQSMTSTERGVVLLDCIESRLEAVPSDIVKVVGCFFI
jgi:hypothetical protein